MRTACLVLPRLWTLCSISPPPPLLWPILSGGPNAALTASALNACSAQLTLHWCCLHVTHHLNLPYVSVEGWQCTVLPGTLLASFLGTPYCPAPRRCWMCLVEGGSALHLTLLDSRGFNRAIITSNIYWVLLPCQAFAISFYRHSDLIRSLLLLHIILVGWMVNPRHHKAKLVAWGCKAKERQSSNDLCGLAQTEGSNQRTTL